jgi:serine/threonine-protein phosphatase 5
MSEHEVNVAESEQLKLEANKCFVNKHYKEAIELYSQAISKNPTNAILFANRSACQLHIENYGTAIADATTAIELDPTYLKVRDRPST